MAKFEVTPGPASALKSPRGGRPKGNQPPSGAPDQIVYKGGIPSLFLSEKGALEQQNARDQIVDRPAPTYATTQPSAVDAANALDASRMGFTVDFNNPAVDAIDRSVAGMYGPSFNGGWGSTGFVLPSMNQVEANGLPIDNGTPLNLPMVSAAPAASPVAQLFAPETSRPARAAAATRPRPITHDYARVKSAGERTDVMGNDMAFMPASVQTSSRWNTGY